MWTLALGALALAAPVTFEVNDALVKDRPLPEVVVRAAPSPDAEPLRLGVTGADGRLAADLAPGNWFVSYGKDGYVPIPGSHTSVPAEGTTITATLSPLLESTGDAGRRRVQIVLNWGSDWRDVRDADAHLVCADGFEVYFGDKDHASDGHEVRLDVDDVDWGGPETITLVDPPPGRYTYFVRDFSAGAKEGLGGSAVVVRVVLDDAPAGEFLIPADLRAEDWFPFEALVVEEDGRARIDAFTPEEIAAGKHERSRLSYSAGCGDGSVVLFLCFAPVPFAVVWAFGRMVRRGFRGR